jgi:membrane-associated phospholipid phosphatase
VRFTRYEGVATMKQILNYTLALSALLLIPLFHTFYNLLNNDQRGAQLLITKVDEWIPFVDVFIIPYIIWYPFIFLTLAYICWKDRLTYWKTLTTMLLAMLACYFIYFVFQTHVPRPELQGEGFFTTLVKVIYANDEPYNAFPSIHSLTSFLMLYGIMKAKNINKKVVATISITAILIIISTLFVKQHVILDAISAILLGYIFYQVVEVVVTLSARLEMVANSSIRKSEFSRIGNR